MKCLKHMLLVVASMVLAAGFLLGCGSEGSSFSLLEEVDIFQQAEGSVNSKVDILWVIDNSGSMETSQKDVTDNFGVFINDFVGLDLDFKIAVASTDAYKVHFFGDHDCSEFKDGVRNSSCNRVVGYEYSGVNVILPSTLDIIGTFLINAVLTNEKNNIYGSGDERPLHSMEEALEEERNAGFLRPDSFLSVIMVTDEDDFSHDGSDFSEDYNNPGMYSVQSYVDYLDNLTGTTDPTRRRFSVSAAAIFDETCRQQLTDDWPGRKIAQRVGELVDLTDGTKVSLCDDFADELKVIADNILADATEYFLQRIPIPETIVVIVNGQVEDPSHWTYEESSNSIRFVAPWFPAAGSIIQVVYDPANYGS